MLVDEAYKANVRQLRAETEAKLVFPSSSCSGERSDDDQIFIFGHEKCVKDAEKMLKEKLKRMMNVDLPVEHEDTQGDSFLQLL